MKINKGTNNPPEIRTIEHIIAQSIKHKTWCADDVGSAADRQRQWLYITSTLADTAARYCTMLHLQVNRITLSLHRDYRELKVITRTQPLTNTVFTLYSRLYNRLYNWLYSRLYEHSRLYNPGCMGAPRKGQGGSRDPPGFRQKNFSHIITVAHRVETQMQLLFSESVSFVSD